MKGAKRAFPLITSAGPTRNDFSLRQHPQKKPKASSDNCHLLLLTPTLYFPVQRETIPSRLDPWYIPDPSIVTLSVRGFSSVVPEELESRYRSKIGHSVEYDNEKSFKYFPSLNEELLCPGGTPPITLRFVRSGIHTKVKKVSFTDKTSLEPLEDLYEIAKFTIELNWEQKFTGSGSYISSVSTVRKTHTHCHHLFFTVTYEHFQFVPGMATHCAIIGDFMVVRESAPLPSVFFDVSFAFQ